ncbi:Insulin-induced protein 2 protein, partial [Lobosporangium transversale]
MEHDLDLDIGLDPGITKDDFLCSTLSPSSSSTSLYQLQGSYAHHRREPTSSAYTTTTTTTIITTTTTTTTTAIATSTSSTASADSIMSEKPSLASTLMPVPSYQEDYHQLYNDNGELSIFPSLRLASEGPYLFLFDYSISLYFPIRMLILFVLGFAFSLVVDHLQTQHNLTTYPNNIHQLWATASWLPPICGVSAVLIGSIYPLGDYLWWGRRVVRDGRDWSSVM